MFIKSFMQHQGGGGTPRVGVNTHPKLVCQYQSLMTNFWKKGAPTPKSVLGTKYLIIIFWKIGQQPKSTTHVKTKLMGNQYRKRKKTITRY